jgi:spore maturation protein CgeB
MRILTVLESPSWVDHHIVGSLEELGHTVHQFSYGQCVGEFYGRARHDEQKSKNIQLFELAKSLLHSDGLDLIFCYVYDDFLLPEFAKALADLDVPMVNYNVDMVNQWYRQIRTAKYFTRILCAQRVNMENMARYEAKVMYFPMAARSPTTLHVAEDQWQPAAPVTFVGTPMLYRTEILRRLHKAGVPLAIYGKYWMEQRQAAAEHNIEKTFSDLHHYALAKFRAEGISGFMRALSARLPNRKIEPQLVASEQLPPHLIHGFVPNGSMSAMFSHSKINLGFNRMMGSDPDIAGVNQIKLRDFEVPMAGGFYLVEKSPDYDSLFIPGCEIETWSNTGELLEKIQYYLEHDTEREAIAGAAKIRAQAEHTWGHRFQKLFDELGISA